MIEMVVTMVLTFSWWNKESKKYVTNHRACRTCDFLLIFYVNFTRECLTQSGLAFDSVSVSLPVSVFSLSRDTRRWLLITRGHPRTGQRGSKWSSGVPRVGSSPWSMMWMERTRLVRDCRRCPGSRHDRFGGWYTTTGVNDIRSNLHV